MTNVPLVATGLTYIAVSENALPTDLGPLERIVSYVGLLAMGWFFWKRETNRTDRSIEDLKAEIVILKKVIEERDRDIRALLENRTKKRQLRRPEQFYEDDSNYDDENLQE